MKYNRPVFIGDDLLARAEVKDINENKYLVNVQTKRHKQTVFAGDFILFPRNKRGDFN